MVAALTIGAFFLLIFLTIFFTGILNQGGKSPKVVNDVIDAAFNPDVEDMLDFIRRGIYGSGTLPDNDYELAQLAYSLLIEWAAKGDGES